MDCKVLFLILYVYCLFGGGFSVPSITITKWPTLDPYLLNYATKHSMKIPQRSVTARGSQCLDTHGGFSVQHSDSNGNEARIRF